MGNNKGYGWGYIKFLEIIRLFYLKIKFLIIKYYIIVCNKRIKNVFILFVFNFCIIFLLCFDV